MKISTIKLFACLVFSIVSTVGFAQLPMVRTTFTAPFVSVNSGSGGGTLSTAFGDDASQDSIPLGFTFNYLGTGYSSVAVSTNGWVSLTGDISTNIQASNSGLFTTTGPNLALGPWWDDLAADSIVYRTTGTAGSQVFTMQWYAKSYYFTSTQNILFQVKLFETTNVIEFHYGPFTASTANTSESASIGIEGATGGPGNFIDAVTGSSFVGAGYRTAATKWPTRFYRFTPGTPTALTGGTYNVGMGQTYPTLDEAVADLNHRGITGSVVLSLTQSLYDVTPTNGDNVFPVFFGPINGLSSTNTITVQPASGTSTLSYEGEASGFATNFASTAAYGTGNEPILGVVGGNNITFKNLYLTGSSSTIADRGVSFINYSANLGSTFCSVRNCSVSLNRGNTSSMGFETRIVTTPTVATGANSNNTFMDFAIQNSYLGMLLSGNATYPDINNMITTSSPSVYNTIGSPSTANDIGNGTALSYGIQASSQSGVTIRNNMITNVSVNGSVVSDGIFLNLLQGVSHIHNNKVMNIRNNSTTATTGVSGIRANVATTGTHEIRVFNNFVSGITSAYAGVVSSTRQIKGIYVQSAGGGASTQTINIDFNNVSIDGSGSANISNTCFEMGTSTGPVFKVRNNVFANFTGAQTSTARHLTWHSTSATLIGNTGSVSNYNDLYIANPTQGFVGQGSTTTYATLANWQTATGQDANSQSCSPTFSNNVTDLHVASSCLDGTGNMAGITWVTTDIDNTVRSSPPDIGADEFTLVGCTTASGGTQSVTSFSRCVGQTASLSSAGATIGSGITYQWQVSTTSGGPYTNVSGGTGANNSSYTTGTLTAGTYYYVMLTTCTITSATGTSNEATVTVNPIPVVSVSPTSGTICLPGGSAVALTASGATNYSWTPTAGLTSTTGVSVNALPLSTTVYSVVGESLGCVAAATATISVAENPSMGSISASPTVVCSGNSSTLNINAATTSAYSITGIPYAAIPTPSTGVTTLASNGTAVVTLSSGSLDDGGWSNQSIPFNFHFYGGIYSSFALSTNGFIYLGTGNPSSYSNYGIAFPSTTPARPSIGAMYSDLDFDGVGSGSTIEYFTVGTSPNQQLVVNWTGQYYNNTGTVTTQAILYESTNIIEVHTFASTGVNTAVQGIQNAAGTAASVVSGRNDVTFTITVPEGQRWTPVGSVAYNWTPSTFLSATNVSNPVANTVTATTAYSVAVTTTAGCSAGASITLSVTPNPTVIPSASSPTLCSGSTTTLSATGATSYTWSTGAMTASTVESPSVTTTYTVTGENTGCLGMDVITVSVTATPTVAASVSTPSICSGSTATLSATGATTYSWSSGAMTASTVESPSSTTTYTVYGEDLGCTGTDVVTLSVTTTPTVATTASPAFICSGSTSTLSATGAISYTWSTGTMASGIVESPTVTTTYTVNGEDSGCFGSSMITLTVNPNPTVTATASSMTICSGSTTTLNATGATSYTWSSGAMTASSVETPTTNTTYTVTGDMGGCVDTDVISVAVNASPTVAAATSNSIICAGSTVTLTASGATTYTWSSGTMAATSVESPTTTVSYTVTGEDANGCMDTDTITQFVSPCTGIDVKLANAEILLYPNPNQGTLNIYVPDVTGKVSFELYDALGRVVMSMQLTDNLTNLNTAELPGGVYTYKISSSGNLYQQGKLIRD